jgi:pimeloyl-ACP methyl ester carboxylesterase
MLKHEIVGSGPPVLLLPSMLGTIEAEWRPYIQPIADLGYRVIAADWPGHSHSDMTKAFTFRVLTEEIDTLLKSLDCDPVVILGYSMGGYAALHFAIKHPTRVIGIWMHGTKFYWSGAEADSMAESLDLAWLQENDTEQLEKLTEIHGENLEELLPWLNKMTINLPDTGLTGMDLEGLEIPVLVSVGDRDELIPVEEAVDLFRALPNSQFAVFADTNHPIQSLRDHVAIPFVKDFLNRLG